MPKKTIEVDSKMIDLVDKGLIDSSYQGQDCRTVRSSFEIADAEANRLLLN